MPKRKRTRSEIVVAKKDYAFNLLATGVSVKKTHAAVKKRYGSGLNSGTYYELKKGKGKSSDLVILESSTPKDIKALAKAFVEYLNQNKAMSVTVKNDGSIELVHLKKDIFHI